MKDLQNLTDKELDDLLIAGRLTRAPFIAEERRRRLEKLKLTIGKYYQYYEELDTIYHIQSVTAPNALVVNVITIRSDGYMSIELNKNYSDVTSYCDEVTKEDFTEYVSKLLSKIESFYVEH